MIPVWWCVENRACYPHPVPQNGSDCSVSAYAPPVLRQVVQARPELVTPLPLGVLQTTLKQLKGPKSDSRVSFGTQRKVTQKWLKS